jgi:hypothetical protein
VYLTQLNSYGSGAFLDTGWVAGYLLIGLGALRAAYAPSSAAAEPRVTTLSLLTPYVPVLAVLAVTSVELLLGHRLGSVDWIMVFALAVLVIARQLLGSWDRSAHERTGENGDRYDVSAPMTEPDDDPVLSGL